MTEAISKPSAGWMAPRSFPSRLRKTRRTQLCSASPRRTFSTLSRATRRFCKPDGVPLVFNQHFTGTMDHWDPSVTDGIAKDREVILFNNAGISSSFGEVPTTFEKMGANAVAFIKALKLAKVDVLGFSIGGFVAQEIALQAPDLVRRLILVGTGPRGGEGMATFTPEAQQIFGATYKVPEELWLKVHFTDSEASQAAGRELLKRFLLRAG